MWKSEVEKYIKLLENSAVEVLSNGVLNYEQLNLYMFCGILNKFYISNKPFKKVIESTLYQIYIIMKSCKLNRKG